MKTFLSCLAALVAAPLLAQEPVTTGVVQKIDSAKGMVTVLSDQTHHPMDFYGVDKAVMVSTTTPGTAPMFSDLKEGMNVTMQYAERNHQWYVEKVIFGGETPMPTAAGAAPAPMPMTTVPSPNTTGASNPAKTGSGPSAMPLPSSLQQSSSSSNVPTPNTTGASNPAKTGTGPSAMPAPSVQNPAGGSVVRNRAGGNAPQ